MNEYTTRFFTNLKRSFETQEDFYPDITLYCTVDESCLPCHRIILATSSEYFKNVFSWSSGNIIEVHNNITGEILSIILEFIYSGTINLTLENAIDILCASNYFNLLEIVDICTDFMLQNLEIHTCVDILLLAYQLDLKELIIGCISFIACNFSYITNDTMIQSKLNALPTSLLYSILSSDELVTRDPETDLPTRPVVREKHVLEYVMNYCKTATDDIISYFLPCVKWHLFKIFGEVEYVQSRFIPFLNGAKEKEELDKLLEIKYSDWFLLPNEYQPSAEDKAMYRTRDYTCSELVPLSPMASRNHILSSVADGNQVTATPVPFSCIASPDECVRKIDIVMRMWDGRYVVAGFGLHFSSGDEKSKNRRMHIGVSKENGVCVESIELEKKEHIIAVNGCSGYLIDNLEFKTSEYKTYGPYGGNGGCMENLMDVLGEYHSKGGYFDHNRSLWCKSMGSESNGMIEVDSILVGITGREVITNGDLAITHLSFIFRSMLPSSEFLISSKKEYEILITDSKFKEPLFSNERSGDIWLPSNSFLL